MTDKHMDAVMDCVRFLEGEGYTVIYVALYGSQNYGMDTPHSDHDFKAVVAPKLYDIALGKQPVSKCVEFGDGLVDIKDVRCMVDNWKKQNVNFLELLFTKWFYLNPEFEDFMWFRENANAIAHADEGRAINAMLGMMREKQHALCKDYPAQLKDIEAHGYSAKQLCHIIRLNDLMKDYFLEDFGTILRPMEARRVYMMKVKTYEQLFTPEQAQAVADALVRTNEEVRESYKDKVAPIQTSVMAKMDEHKVEAVKHALQLELLKEDM
jgi:predicted nucleotidyltransferase